MDITKSKKKLLLTIGVDEGEIQPKARFIEDLDAESLDSVELIIEFEEN